MKKSHLLTLSIGGSAIVASICLGMVFGAKGNFKAIGQVDETWHHYAERMPGLQPGIKEYWVGCNSNEHLFAAPTEGSIVDKDTAWDTSGFAENDDRYTYACTHKVADSAIAGTTAASDATFGIGNYFTSYQGKDYTANASNGADVDISNYDYLTFGLAIKDMGYLCLFGGNGGVGDAVETCISQGKNFTMWNDAWYYFTLEKNTEGKWDAYVGKFANAKRYSASLPMDADRKSASNLKDLLYTYKFEGIPEGSRIFATPVYGAEKDHHFGAWTQTCVDAVETRTCPVCGATEERPFNLNFQNNTFGASLYNENAGADVSTWGDGYNGGPKVNAYEDDSIAYAYYAWNDFTMTLPKIKFASFSSVVFELQNFTTAAEPSFSTYGFKIGFEPNNRVVFSNSTETAFSSGTLKIFNIAGNVYAVIYGLGAADNIKYQITDSDIINGVKGLPIYFSCATNDGGCAMLFKNMTVNTEDGFQNMTKISDNAGNSSFTGQNLNAPFGFQNAWDKTGITAGQNFIYKSVDISTYSKVMYGVYLSESSLYLFSGDNSQSVNVWGPRWVIVELVKNNGTWSVFYKEYNFFSVDWTANTKLALTDTNMSSFTSVNWQGSETAIIGLTELYAI